MKALEILKNAKGLGFTGKQIIINKYKLEEAIKELEEYESDMDSYLDYTTGSRCTKSFNSCLGSIKIAYGKELEKIVKENSEDRLAELEKVILDYLTKKGFVIDDISCKFEIYLETKYKLKQIQVDFKRGVGFHSSNIFQTKAERTKEMFDKAFEFFSIKEQEPNKEFKVLQGDEFSPPFVVKTFKTKKEADDFVDEIQKESSNHDEYTTFWVEEVNG